MVCEYLSLGLHVGNHSRTMPLIRTSYLFCFECILPGRMSCRSLGLVSLQGFLAGFFRQQSNHSVLLVVTISLISSCPALVISLAYLPYECNYWRNLEDNCIALRGFQMLDSLFSVLWCLAKT